MNLQFTIYIDATPEKVWSLFTSPEHTRKLYYDCVLRSTFEEGAALEYVGPGNDGPETVHIYGTVLHYEPGRQFSYIEHPGATYYPNHAELSCRVTYTLEPIGACTKLTLLNDEWSEGHPGYQKTADVWPMLLSDIKTYAETGKTLDLGW